MATTDPRVDAYIERALLQALRQVVHTGCPSAVETIKWGMPFFTVDGRILAHMAAFRQHCAFDFWQGRGVADRGKDDDAMGQFGRIASTADLPPRRPGDRVAGRRQVEKLKVRGLLIQAPAGKGHRLSTSRRAAWR